MRKMQQYAKYAAIAYSRKTDRPWVSVKVRADVRVRIRFR